MDWSLMPEYRIVPGDVLKLNFGPRVEEPDEDLVREVHVRPDGRISLYPVGEVVAAGRTPAELHDTLFGLFSGYLRDRASRSRSPISPATWCACGPREELGSARPNRSSHFASGHAPGVRGRRRVNSAGDAPRWRARSGGPRGWAPR
jgi:hypothetical protein